LRVLDLSRLLPGPWASLVLADLGADVVKIEDPGGGDYMRYTPPIHGDVSLPFASLNRGKRSVSLDLKNKDDRALFLELAKVADVVLESFRPGVMARLGLGWEVLSKANPKLVLCSISGYGQNGPYREKAGHDINYLALSGVLGLLGAADGPPGQPNVQFADVAGGGLTALVGMLAALFERQRTGRGRWVDTSMTEGVMSAAVLSVGSALTSKANPSRGEGTLSGEVPCYAIYRTRDDRYLALGALEPKFWAGFCHALGRPDLEDKGLVGGEEGREVKRAVGAIVAEQPLAHWVAHFAAHDACVEPVLTPREVVEHPLHVARGSFFDAAHGRAQRTAVRFADREDPPAAGAAPGLGADRAAVLAEWLGHPRGT
jgi:crotonobetainyl-CoA:carnitine CoA-transferase CaiB-like acyl-CoA transferase